MNASICPICGSKEGNLDLHVFTEHEKYFDNYQRLQLKTTRRGGKHRKPPVLRKLGTLYGSRCAKCGKKTDLSVDHVTPKSWTNNNSFYNKQILCKDCNQEKGNKSDADYR